MPIALLTLLGLLLRLHGLHQSPWYDEAQTIDLIRRPFGSMMSTIPKEEATPPLYYMLAWVWVKIFGAGVVSFRLFSVVPGVATIPMAWMTAKRMLPNIPRAAVIVAALTACNPMLIWYSQEVRPYSLMLASTTASLLAFTYLLERATTRRIVVWAILAGLALTTQYFAAILIAPEAVYLIYRYHRGRPTWLGIGILALFALALIPGLMDENSKLSFAYITVFPLGLRIGQVFSQFLVGNGAPAWNLFKSLAFLCVIGAVALMYFRGTPREQRAARPPLKWAAVGLLLPILAAIIGTDRLIARDLLPIWIPAMVFLGACLGIRRGPRLGTALAVALCAIGIFVAIAQVSNTFLQRPDWHGVADAAGLRAPSNDGKTDRRVLIVMNNQGVLQLGIYMHSLGHFVGWREPDVTEVDVIVARSPHDLRQPNCWWGAGCQIGPSTFRHTFRDRIYRIQGFREVSITHVRQFRVMKFVTTTGAPVTLTKGILRKALRKDAYRSSQLIVQGPHPVRFRMS